MARSTEAVAEAVDVSYRFDRFNIPKRKRIGMTEGHKLPDSPSRSSLYGWCTRGVVVRRGLSLKLKLPTFQIGGRRFTTLEAYEWWHAMLDKLASLDNQQVWEILNTSTVTKARGRFSARRNPNRPRRKQKAR